MAAPKRPRSFGTHDGTFHADEVTACALLLLFGCIDLDKIVRTRDPTTLNACEYICDVGGQYNSALKLFDHHQAEYQGNLSSAGMVLLYLKEQKTLSQREYDFLNDALILGVDAHDNGKDPQIKGLCSYSHIITSFTPIRNDVDAISLDAAFFEALLFSKNFLSRVWEHDKYNHSCQQIIAETMAKSKECLIFDQNIPWLDIFFELDGEHHPALFVIMPSDKHWKLRGIPPNYEKRMQVRVPLPKEWAGLLEEDLKRVSGIPGAIFCHKGRFISVWETREDAMKALEKVLHQQGVKA
ncbi:MAG: MYG1 family protein [Parachlamydiaceae bacterium]|nr:MYG1 family protein [Parachlamydiaceae bacterium]